jgi:hypothetical protein
MVPRVPVWFPNNKHPGNQQQHKYWIDTCAHAAGNKTLPTPPGGGLGLVVPVVLARGKHPVPSRTRKLSPSAPMVLHGRLCGRVGHRRTQHTQKGPPPQTEALSTFQEAVQRAGTTPIRSICTARQHNPPARRALADFPSPFGADDRSDGPLSIANVDPLRVRMGKALRRLCPVLVPYRTGS